MKENNILVLGYGLLGSEIVKQTGWKYLSRSETVFDFCDIKSYSDKLHDYDTILNCVGFTDTYSDNKDKHKSINYLAVTELSDFCQQTNKKLIHISTSYVYGFSQAFATETDIALISKNWYSYYKLLADEYIMLKNKNHLICRCVFKPKPFPYESAWVDQIGNVDYVDVIANLIIKLININASGLYNVGTEPKTIYELAILTRPDVKMTERPLYAPEDTTMNIEKLKNILYKFD